MKDIHALILTGGGKNIMTRWQKSPLHFLISAVWLCFGRILYPYAEEKTFTNHKEPYEYIINH